MSLVSIPQELETLLAQPVAVFGLGVSGQALLGLIERIGASYIAYDTREGGEDVRRDFDLRASHDHRLVVFSPGFTLDHPWIQQAHASGCTVMGEMEFASHFWTGPMVAITGSNGKTTLTECLTFALKRMGTDAVAVGNIGYSISRIAASHEYEGLTAVCEISSFQAEGLDQFRADSLIWINFNDNHLDRYGSRRDYFAAKWRLVERLRKPVLIIGPTVAEAAEEFGYQLPDYTQVVDPHAYERWEMPRTSAFSAWKQGENLLLLRRWWEFYEYPPDVLREAAEQFTVRPHRMKPLQPINGVTYWNDSKATNFAACLAALENFDNQPIWIGGGLDRKGDEDAFVKQLAPRIRAAFLIGQTAPALAEKLRALGVPVTECADVSEAVRAAHAVAQPGVHVLFSPAYASQDMFKSYIERGTAFENAVFSLKGVSSED